MDTRKKVYAQTTNNKTIDIKRMLFIKLNSSNHYNPIDCYLLKSDWSERFSTINVYIIQIVLYPFVCVFNEVLDHQKPMACGANSITK